MLNQMLSEKIADKKDGTATEAKGIAAFKPTLGASSREIAALNKLIDVLQKQIELDTKWIMQMPLGADGPRRRRP